MSEHKPILSIIPANEFCPSTNQNYKFETSNGIIYVCNTTKKEKDIERQPIEEEKKNNIVPAPPASNELAGAFWGVNRFNHIHHGWNMFPRVGFPSVLPTFAPPLGYGFGAVVPSLIPTPVFPRAIYPTFVPRVW